MKSICSQFRSPNAGIQFLVALIAVILPLNASGEPNEKAKPALDLKTEESIAPEAGKKEESRSIPDQEVDVYNGLDHSGTPAKPPKEDRQPEQSANPGIKRSVPNYRGRPEDSPSAGEVLIWIPRVVFYPVYAVLEYALRFPIVKVIAFAEEYHLPQRVKRFFTFSEGRGGLFPTMFYDFGISPSIGLYFFYDDLGFESNDLVLQAGFWPTDKYHFICTDSFKVFRNQGGTVTVRGEFIYGPDMVFHGLGPDSRQADKRFFQLRQTEAELRLRAALKDLNRVSLRFYYKNAKMTGGNDPSIDASDSPFDVTDSNVVPWYGKTYNILVAKVKLELDTRSPERMFTPGSGLRLEAFSSFNIDPQNSDLLFFRYGYEIAGFLDLSGVNHVLALRIYSEILDNVGESLVPVPELLSLGGSEYLRGFLAGRFRGDSTFVLTADYRYPIHRFFDANFFTSVGNVFDGRLANLHPKRMVMSWGIGVRSNTSRNVSFDIMVAFGTNQLGDWEEEFKVDNVRFMIGLNQGF